MGLLRARVGGEGRRKSDADGHGVPLLDSCCMRHRDGCTALNMLKTTVCAAMGTASGL